MPTRKGGPRAQRQAREAAEAPPKPKRKKAPEPRPEPPPAPLEPEAPAKAPRRNPLFPVGIAYWPLDAETMSFSDWYMTWLKESLHTVSLKSRITGLLRRRTTAAGYPITHPARRRDLLTLLGLIIAGVLLGLVVALLRR